MDGCARRLYQTVRNVTPVESEPAIMLLNVQAVTALDLW